MVYIEGALELCYPSQWNNHDETLSGGNGEWKWTAGGMEQQFFNLVSPPRIVSCRFELGWLVCCPAMPREHCSTEEEGKTPRFFQLDLFSSPCGGPFVSKVDRSSLPSLYSPKYSELSLVYSDSFAFDDHF